MAALSSQLGAVGLAAHALGDVAVGEPVAKLGTGVLAAAVAVVDEAGQGGPGAAVQRTIQRGQRQPGRKSGVGAPAEDAAAKNIHFAKPVGELDGQRDGTRRASARLPRAPRLPARTGAARSEDLLPIAKIPWGDAQLPHQLRGPAPARPQGDRIALKLFIVASAFHFGWGRLFSALIHCGLGSLPCFCHPPNRNKFPG